MNFTLITADEFRAYAAKSPYKSFMQTPEIAELRERQGWTAYYFAAHEGARSNNSSQLSDNAQADAIAQIKAAAMVVAKPTFLGKSTFFCPGGPLVDYEDTATLNFFMHNLKKYLKSHNGYVLKIDPYYELAEYGRHGEPLEGHSIKTAAIKNLQNLGFTEVGSDQPKYLFALELGGETPDELMAQFKANTRNHIRKAEKKGVRVRELTRSELPILKNITASTSERRGFTDRPLGYYEQMFDLFGPQKEVKFLVAEAEVKADTGAGTGAVSKSKNPHSPKTPLSAAMFMLYGDEVVYLFSGSDEQYMRDYNAQYAIQWHMIQYAAAHGYKRYNFYGIHGRPDEHTKDGIYDFKKGFTSDKNGRVVELIGSYQLPISPGFYHLHEILKKLKH